MTQNEERTEAGSRQKPMEDVDDPIGLYRRAFAEFGSRALWNVKQYQNPTPDQMLAITRQLRTEGDMNARRLAERIEQATRANL